MKLIPLRFQSTTRDGEEVVFINPHQVASIRSFNGFDRDESGEVEIFPCFSIIGPNGFCLASGTGSARDAAEALRFAIDSQQEVK